MERSSDVAMFPLDPEPGTILVVTAGAETFVEFSFRNDTPDVANFSLEVDGIPDHWTTGAGTSGEAMCAAFGSGVIRLRLCPPAPVEPGDYDVVARVITDHLAVKSVAMVLRVVRSDAYETAVDTINQPEGNVTSTELTAPNLIIGARSDHRTSERERKRPRNRSAAKSKKENGRAARLESVAISGKSEAAGNQSNVADEFHDSNDRQVDPLKRKSIRERLVAIYSRGGRSLALPLIGLIAIVIAVHVAAIIYERETYRGISIDTDTRSAAPGDHITIYGRFLTGAVITMGDENPAVDVTVTTSAGPSIPTGQIFSGTGIENTDAENKLPLLDAITVVIPAQADGHRVHFKAQRVVTWLPWLTQWLPSATSRNPIPIAAVGTPAVTQPARGAYESGDRILIGISGFTTPGVVTLNGSVTPASWSADTVAFSASAGADRQVISVKITIAGQSLDAGAYTLMASRGTMAPNPPGTPPKPGQSAVSLPPQQKPETLFVRPSTNSTVVGSGVSIFGRLAPPAPDNSPHQLQPSVPPPSAQSSSTDLAVVANALRGNYADVTHLVGKRPSTAMGKAIGAYADIMESNSVGAYILINQVKPGDGAAYTLAHLLSYDIGVVSAENADRFYKAQDRPSVLADLILARLYADESKMPNAEVYIQSALHDAHGDQSESAAVYATSALLMQLHGDAPADIQQQLSRARQLDPSIVSSGNYVAANGG